MSAATLRFRAGYRVDLYGRLIRVASRRAASCWGADFVNFRFLSDQASRSVSSGGDSVAEFNEELESVFGGGPAATSYKPDFARGGAERPSTGVPERAPSADREQSAGPSTDGPGPDAVARLSHVDASGSASMVDVSAKRATRRVAVATGRILLGSEAFSLVAANQIAKGDVLTVAQIAGINGAKMAASLIPLCHSILLHKVDVSFRLEEERHAVKVRAEATAVGPTGVEMEALTAVTVAALTVYDMCKAVNKRMEIQDIRLESKMGGKSGPWLRDS